MTTSGPSPGSTGSAHDMEGLRKKTDHILTVHQKEMVPPPRSCTRDWTLLSIFKEVTHGREHIAQETTQLCPGIRHSLFRIHYRPVSPCIPRQRLDLGTIHWRH